MRIYYHLSRIFSFKMFDLFVFTERFLLVFLDLDV